MIPQLPAEEIIEALGVLFAQWGYLFVAAAALVENIAIVNFFSPGSTVVWAAGFYASQGLLNPFLVWAVATAAATLGNQLDYLLGYLGIYHLIRAFRLEQRVESYRRKFVHGGHLIDAFLIYLTGYLRSFLLIALGALRVPWPKYLAFTAGSAAIRKGLFVAIGYFLGTNRPLVVWFFTNFWWMGFALILAWFFFHEVVLRYLKLIFARIR